jgi:HSP20 family protein
MKNYNCYGTAYGQPTWANAQTARTHTKPSANILETETAYHIEIAAPSFSKEDFKITIDSKRHLTVAVEKNEVSDNAPKFNHREFRYGSFQRSFILPDNADEKQVSAKYESGILTVSIQKAIPNKTSFEVTVE